MLPGSSAFWCFCVRISLRATFLKLFWETDETCSRSARRGSTGSSAFSSSAIRVQRFAKSLKRKVSICQTNPETLAHGKKRLVKPGLWRDLCFNQRLKTSREQHLTTFDSHERLKLRKQTSQLQTIHTNNTNSAVVFSTQSHSDTEKD